ncbi:MAG: FtsQ-type POTRA domain-containing protein [Microthrixaceae bacterium]
MSTSTPVRSGAKVVASQVEPRIVDRRHKVQLASSRKRHKKQLAIGSLLAFIAACVGLALSPVFSVQEINIAGISRLSEADLLAASGVSLGDHLVTVDLETARKELMGLTWVSSAQVERKWPHSLAIKITEQRPASLVKSDVSYLLISTTGRILGTQLAPDPDMPLLEVDGDPPIAQAAQAGAPTPSAQTDLTGLTVTTEVAQALGVLERMPETLRSELSAARLSESGELRLELNDGTQVLFGPPEDVAAKLLAVESVLNQVVRECMKTLDVREPTRAAVSRGPGCAGISPASSAQVPGSSGSSSSKKSSSGSSSSSGSNSSAGSAVSGSSDDSNG